MSDLRVSDHALLRFLDRAGELDVEELRARLEESLGRAGKAAASICAEDYLIQADGLTYVVREAVVVTILHPRGHAKRHEILARPKGGRK